MEIKESFSIRVATVVFDEKMGIYNKPTTVLNNMQVYADGEKYILLMENKEQGIFYNRIDKGNLILCIYRICKSCPCRIEQAYENAFASAELSAISVLFTLPSKEILKCRNHKKRLSQFKDWADLGNVKMEFSTTLSKLSELRDSARYLHSDKYKDEDPKKIKNIIEEMIIFAENSIK